MAIYLCSQCDQYRDDDYDPPEDHPAIPWGMMCTSCAAEMEDAENEDNDNGEIDYD